MTRRFVEIESSGDVGIEAWAESRAGLFEALAEGLFGLMATGRPEPRVQRRISVESPSTDDLVVDWLAEIVYSAASHAEVYGEVRVTKIDETSVEATLSGEGIDPERHGLRFDVKAATYHGLLVEAGAKGFHARVIFDL